MERAILLTGHVCRISLTIVANNISAECLSSGFVWSALLLLLLWLLVPLLILLLVLLALLLLLESFTFTLTVSALFKEKSSSSASSTGYISRAIWLRRGPKLSMLVVTYFTYCDQVHVRRSLGPGQYSTAWADVPTRSGTSISKGSACVTNSPVKCYWSRTGHQTGLTNILTINDDELFWVNALNGQIVLIIDSERWVIFAQKLLEHTFGWQWP